MGPITILWCLAAGVAMTLAVVSALLWMTERDSPTGLVLLIIGLAVAIATYLELCMMHSTTPIEYGKWLRLYHVPVFFVLVGQVFFVRFYLGTGRLWLMWTVILARLIVLVVNFSVHPNFNFLTIVALRQASFLGERISRIGVAVPRAGWQAFALASLALLTAYFVDAAVQRWRSGDKESRRKALAASIAVTAPMVGTVVYIQLVIFGVFHGPVTNVPWFLGTLLMMAYELGRDFVLSRRAVVQSAELERQLMQSERVSMLGQLASALTHELAQPLSANTINAASALKLLEDETPDLEELRATLGDIQRDTQRGTELIAHMRPMYKSRAIEMQPLKMDDVVQDVVALVGRVAAAKHVALLLLVQPDLPRVVGDRVHLSQVLFNLLMNGIQAVQCRSPDARRVILEAHADNGRGEFEMTVRDSGEGIPEGIIDKMFRPFFTTKPEGMGVGLTLSRTIIEAHGGRLWVDSSSKQDGAVFRFTLQRA